MLDTCSDRKNVVNPGVYAVTVTMHSQAQKRSHSRSLNILFCGYRDWAIKAIPLEQHNDRFFYASDPESMQSVIDEHPDLDLIFLIGWSWIVPSRLCDRYDMFAFHPSDLPLYAGGSPLQHQILDGITQTKMSLFRVSTKLDGGDVYAKDDLDLDGNMRQIFERMAIVTARMIESFLRAWPNIRPIMKQENVKPRKRLKAEHSELKHEQLASMTARQLYDFIRCKTDPYPNAYVEDETGRLYFSDVSFKEPEV